MMLLLSRNSLPVLKEYRGLEIKCLKNYIVDMDFFAYKDSMHIYEESTVNEYISNKGWVSKRAKNHPDFGFCYIKESIDKIGSILYSKQKYVTRNNDCDIFLFDYSWGHNYQHWLISSLGRLFVYCELKKYNPKLKLLIGDKMPKYKSEAITLLGISDDDLICHREVTKYRKIYTCNFNSGSGLRVSHLSYYYYEKMANLINFTDDFGRKIYIARDDSRGKRPLINRSELNALMTKRGFNVVFLEELSFYEKIALFKSADIIIGDFSSGWGHIVFCEKFTKLILLEHDIYKFQGFYKEIANSKCLDLKVVETKNIFRLMYLKFLKLIWTLLKDVDKRANSLSWKVNIKELMDFL